jgi:hypothetical protein
VHVVTTGERGLSSSLLTKWSAPREILTVWSCAEARQVGRGEIGLQRRRCKGEFGETADPRVGGSCDLRSLLPCVSSLLGRESSWAAGPGERGENCGVSEAKPFRLGGVLIVGSWGWIKAVKHEKRGEGRDLAIHTKESVGAAAN